MRWRLGKVGCALWLVSIACVCARLATDPGLQVEVLLLTGKTEEAWSHAIALDDDSACSHRHLARDHWLHQTLLEDPGLAAPPRPEGAPSWVQYGPHGRLVEQWLRKFARIDPDSLCPPPPPTAIRRGNAHCFELRPVFSVAKFFFEPEGRVSCSDDTQAAALEATQDFIEVWLLFQTLRYEKPVLRAFDLDVDLDMPRPVEERLSQLQLTGTLLPELVSGRLGDMERIARLYHAGHLPTGWDGESATCISCDAHLRADAFPPVVEIPPCPAWHERHRSMLVEVAVLVALITGVWGLLRWRQLRR